MRITVAELVADPDGIAPVSGLRCRGCGRNARLRPPDEAWEVRHLAAYCPECTQEAVDDA